jgi:hypothetical protein
MCNIEFSSPWGSFFVRMIDSILNLQRMADKRGMVLGMVPELNFISL